MSTASEHRAWRGNKPPSLSRPSATQSRSAGASPSVSGATTPVSAQAKPDTSKPLATTKPVEELSAQRKQIPATSPSGNVWDMRKAAAQQHGRATGTTTPRESKPVPLPENKVDTAVSAQGRVPETEERHIPVNGFNSTEVRDFLAGDASSVQTYRSQNANAGAKQKGRGNMANGQSFFASLSKQIAQLQASK